ncbi:MAG TPA: von Willebrand factor type A domain-containing protein, partial [Thermoanaerobaculia bacterium]|nr:von Willebrand factor type A domain-containing protein [Thermoanaerobaculia bacterium]
MSRLTEREIARRLAEPLDEELPAGLLEKIKSEIPPVVPVGNVRPFPNPAAEPRRQRWLIAASLATAVLGGLVAWQVLWIRPKLDTQQVQVPEKVERQATGSDIPAGPPPPPPPPAAAAPPPADTADASRVAELKKELQELGYSSGGANEAQRLRRQSEPAQPMEVPSTVPAPQADFDGGVEGGVEGGVPGGVVGGVVGGVPGGAPMAERDYEGPMDKDAPLRAGGREFSETIAVAKPKAGTTGGNAEPNDEAYGDNFFQSAGTNPFVDTEEDRLSTFGLDVDTASYTVARRYLEDGNLPNPDSVRVEEFVNFFDYGDPAPTRDDFALKAEGAPTPFAGPGYRLLRFNVKAREIRPEERKPAVLIFVVDVSGSMDMENRLGLVKRSLEMLLGSLRPADKVGLVVYGSEARVVVEPTHDLARVRSAVAGLHTEGATNAEAGITLGYDLANRYFRPEGNNRILLCSDGVANVGNTGPDSILERIGREARKGIELTTLGFGMGNYNDVLMEQLADKGDGRYAYLDSIDEAQRVLVEELEGTLETIAKDAKVQVAFNPEVVARWRLLGYENRDIADEKFRDDSVDAGEIGAGHSVTALYEVKLKPGATADRPVANLHLRWRSEKTGRVREEEKLLRVSQLAGSWEQAT